MVADEQAGQRGIRLEPNVAERDRALDGLVEEDLRPRELAGLHQRLPELGQKFEPLAIAGLEQLRGAAEEVRCCGHVAASERTPTRGAETPGAACSDRCAVRVERAELREVARTPARGGSRGSPRTRSRGRGRG